MMIRNPNRRVIVGGMAAGMAAAAMLPIKTFAQQSGITRKQIEVEAEGGKFDAYLAAPSNGRGPGVIVATHVLGVDQDTKNICDNLAQLGCVAIAQNFFWRDPQDTGILPEAEVRRAIARAMRIDFSRSLDEVKRAIAEVKRHPNHNGKIAVLGYCFGGPHAWRSACDGYGVDASVSFHGTFMSKYMKVSDKPGCPMSLHYGDKDELAPPPELDAVKKVADATGSEFILHPGAGHAYMMPANSHYHAEAARKSWDRALQMINGLRA